MKCQVTERNGKFCCLDCGFTFHQDFVRECPTPKGNRTDKVKNLIQQHTKRKKPWILKEEDALKRLEDHCLGCQYYRGVCDIICSRSSTELVLVLVNGTKKCPIDKFDKTIIGG